MRRLQRPTSAVILTSLYPSDRSSSIRQGVVGEADAGQTRPTRAAILTNHHLSDRTSSIRQGAVGEADAGQTADVHTLSIAESTDTLKTKRQDKAGGRGKWLRTYTLDLDVMSRADIPHAPSALIFLSEILISRYLYS